MRLGNASYNLCHNCTCYLWQKQRWKRLRWQKIQSQHHRCCVQHPTSHGSISISNYKPHIKWWQTLSLDDDDDGVIYDNTLSISKPCWPSPTPPSTVTVTCDHSSSSHLSQPHKHELSQASNWSGWAQVNLWLAKYHRPVMSCPEWPRKCPPQPQQQ